MPSPTGPERLRELSRQIKNLAQRCRAVAASAPTEVEGAADGGWRCAPDSLMCMLVYIFSGHCSNTAADFASGRGWRPGASAAAATEEQLAAVEWAYIRMPTSVLVDLELEPFKMVGQRDVYCAAKYVLEHRLMAYVEVQNTEHGVAPSRAQMVDVALTSIPATAPLCVKERLGVLVRGRSGSTWRPFAADGTQGMGTCAQKIALTLRNAASRPAGIGSLLARSLV